VFHQTVPYYVTLILRSQEGLYNGLSGDRSLENGGRGSQLWVRGVERLHGCRGLEPLALVRDDDGEPSLLRLRRLLLGTFVPCRHGVGGGTVRDEPLALGHSGGEREGRGCGRDWGGHGGGGRNGGPAGRVTSSGGDLSENGGDGGKKAKGKG
jgi:hypothetical protein